MHNLNVSLPRIQQHFAAALEVAFSLRTVGTILRVFSEPTSTVASPNCSQRKSTVRGRPSVCGSFLQSSCSCSSSVSVALQGHTSLYLSLIGLNMLITFVGRTHRSHKEFIKVASHFWSTGPTDAAMAGPNFRQFTPH